VVAAGLAFAAAGLAVLGVGQLAGARTRGRGAWLGSLGAASRLRPPAGLAERIVAAGGPAGLGAGDLMALKAVVAVVGAGVGTVFGAAAPGRLGLLLAAAGPVAGFFAPDLWLAHRARERARTVRRDLPGLLDLLRVSVEAGAPLASALGAVGARARGPLAAEWRAVARQVALGEPLERSLATLERRLPQPEIRALSAALDRSRRHGTPLGRTLAGQARDARLALRRRVEEDAARAAPKIQLVVALLLVPSVLLMVAAALVSALLGDGGGSALPVD
jgi:tight adherence protein C